jgi:uncharacterized protein
MWYREEWLGNFRFVEYEEFKLERPSVLFVALPDTGLVGVISASYMTSKLGLSEVGGVDSPYFPPITVIHKGFSRPPVRIFAGGRLITVFTEVSLLPDVQAQLITSLLDYARLRGVDYVVSSTGIPAHNRLDLDDLRTFYVTSVGGRDDFVEGGGARMLESGLLIGPSAVLLKEGARRRVKVLILLTESFLEFPDPEAAAKGLIVFSKIFGLKVDVADLIEQAEMIKLRARETMKQAVNMMSAMRKDLEYGMPLHM